MNECSEAFTVVHWYCISVKLWYYQDIKIPKLCYEYENFNIKKLFI